MKRTLRSALSVTLAVILCLSLLSCSFTKKKYSDTIYDVFDSFATITVYDASKSDYDVYFNIFKNELNRYHQLFDTYGEYENVVNLCTLNKNAATAPVEVSGTLLEFLEYSVRMHHLTSGYTSITVGALTSLWKTAIENKTLPEQSAIDEAALHIDISCLELELITKTVSFSDSALKLDAGALGKGYAAREVCNSLIEAGCESFLINVGGTVCAFGQKNNNTDWQAGIAAPDGEGETGISVNISGKAMSTSGSYLRGFDLDGVRYHHIINPFTRRPENLYASVSVICASAADADVLSTALFSMTLEEGMALAKALDFKAVWITPDGNITATHGIEIPQ